MGYQKRQRSEEDSKRIAGPVLILVLLMPGFVVVNSCAQVMA